MKNRIFEVSPPHELFTVNERYLHSTEYMREMIASWDDEIKTWEGRAQQIPEEIFRLLREQVECQRDAALARAKRDRMQARLDKAGVQ